MLLSSGGVLTTSAMMSLRGVGETWGMNGQLGKENRAIERSHKLVMNVPETASPGSSMLT